MPKAKKNLNKPLEIIIETNMTINHISPQTIFYIMLIIFNVIYFKIRLSFL